MKLLGILVLAAECALAQTNAVEPSAFGPRRSISVSDMGGTSDGHRSMLRKDNPRAKKRRQQPDILDTLKDDDIFVRVSKDDFLTWKQVREQAEVTIKSQNLPPPPPGTDPGEVKMILDRLLKNNVSKVLRTYLRNAVLADEARKLGIQPPPEAFYTAKTNAVAMYKRQGSVGRKFLALAKEPGSFFERNLTNAVLGNAYFEQVVKKRFEDEIPEKEVDKAIIWRHEWNLSVPVSNNEIRVQMEGILQDLQTNKLTFAEAAEEYSEDGSSVDGGVFGTFERGDIRPELENVFTNLPIGKLSGVVETPYSYHILKVLKQNFEEDDEGNVNSNKVESWEIAHIMIEKYQEKHEFTKQTAKEFLVNGLAKKELKVIQAKMLQEKPIECVVPLQDKKRTKRRKPAKVTPVAGNGEEK